MSSQIKNLAWWTLIKTKRLSKVKLLNKVHFQKKKVPIKSPVVESINKIEHKSQAKLKNSRHVNSVDMGLKAIPLYDLSRYELNPKNLNLDDIGRYLSSKIVSLKIIYNDYLIYSAAWKQNKDFYKRKATMLKKFYLQLRLWNINILNSKRFLEMFKDDVKVMRIVLDLKHFFKIDQKDKIINVENSENAASSSLKSRNKSNLSAINRNFAKPKIQGLRSNKLFHHKSQNLIKERNIKSQLWNILNTNISKSNNTSNIFPSRNSSHNRSTNVSPSVYIKIK